MTDTELELPQGWVLGRISDVVLNPKNDIVDGPFGSNLKSTEYVDQGIPIIRLQNVSRYQFINKNIRYVTKEKAEQLKRHSFLKNDIVMTKLGIPVGKACLVPEFLESGIIVADILRMRVAEKFISKQFILYLINSNFIIKQFAYNTKGTTRPRVNLTKFRNFLIPIPPLNEQKRIVDKIEELFSKIDSTKQSLEYTKLQLELYKLSFLESIFSEFEQKPLSRIAKIISGYSFKSKDFIHEGIPVIKISNISYGKFIEKNQEFLPISYLKKFEDFVVKPKNILIALTRPITNDTVKICEYPEDNPISLLNQRVAKIELLNKFPRKLILYYFQSHNFKDQIIQNMTGTEQPNLSPLKLANFLCPFPPLEKQEQIVSQIEQGFSLIENTSKIVESTLQNLQTMKMSVLKQAFEGKLVPQDPNDEPASVLLEKIKLKN